VTPARSKKWRRARAEIPVAAIFKLQNFQITKLQNFFRLAMPYYEIDPPVDNPRYLP
jgi:hypothetical protein